MAEGLFDFFSRARGQERRAALEGLLTQFIPPELRPQLGLLAEANPVVSMERAGQDAQTVFAPDVALMDRLAAGGRMASNMAGVLAPAAVAGRAGMPVSNAVQEALLGASASPQMAAVRDYLVDDFGGVTVWTGGAGDPMKAASDRGAWFSEAQDLAQEYAGQTGKVLRAEIDPRRPISFRHAEQPRTIGDIINTALEGAGQGADFEAARPIVDRLSQRYGVEARPLFEYWNNDKDVADLFRALGYDSISAAEKSNMRAQTWGALDPSIISLSEQEQY